MSNTRKTTPRARASDAQEAQVAKVQAAAEGITVADGKIEFQGRWFRAAEKPPGQMRMLLFARQVTGGGSAFGELEGMATILDMLEESIHPADFDAFQQHAIDTRAGMEDLMAVMMAATEAATSRPTGQPSGSSDGQPGTSASLTGNSSAAPAPGSAT